MNVFLSLSGVGGGGTFFTFLRVRLQHASDTALGVGDLIVTVLQGTDLLKRLCLRIVALYHLHPPCHQRLARQLVVVLLAVGFLVRGCHHVVGAGWDEGRGG